MSDANTEERGDSQDQRGSYLGESARIRTSHWKIVPSRDFPSFANSTDLPKLYNPAPTPPSGLLSNIVQYYVHRSLKLSTPYQADINNRKRLNLASSLIRQTSRVLPSITAMKSTIITTTRADGQIAILDVVVAHRLAKIVDAFARAVVKTADVGVASALGEDCGVEGEG